MLDGSVRGRSLRERAQFRLGYDIRYVESIWVAHRSNAISRIEMPRTGQAET